MTGDGGTENVVSGTVAGSVVQAGSLHWHATPAEPEVPVIVSVEGLRHADYVQLASGVMVPVSGHLLRIYVEAAGTRTVILRALRPVVESRSAPPEGKMWIHAGVLPVRAFAVDLDEPEPSLRSCDDTPDFPYSVSPGDPEVFDIAVHTTRFDVRWRLALDWACAGRTGTVPAGFGDGQAFRVMPRPRRP